MANKGTRMRWGGITDGRVRPSKYFRIARQDRIFWLVDPDGGIDIHQVNRTRLR
jgi:hypothetical protein